MKQFSNARQWCVRVCIAILCLFPGTATAGSVSLGKAFTLIVPQGWQQATRDFADAIHPTASHMLDCARNDAGETVLVGWKVNDANQMQGAFCVTYAATGFGVIRTALRTRTGEEKEKIASAFMDTMASALVEAYSVKKDMRSAEMSADLLEAGDDIVMIIDCKINDGTRSYVRASTLFLHNDALLTIASVHTLDAPDAVLDDLDALPLSIQWRQDYK